VIGERALSDVGASRRRSQKGATPGTQKQENTKHLPPREDVIPITESGIRPTKKPSSADI